HLADLLAPRLVDPLEDHPREVLLVLELVIKGAAGVAGVARDLLEDEVAVAEVGQPARGGLEQRAAAAGPALGLRRLTSMHVRMLPSGHAASEDRPRLAALADPRDHPRLPRRGRVGAADPRRRRRLPSPGRARHLDGPVAQRLTRHQGALRAALEA